MCVWYAQVNFTPISSPDYERWVAEQSKPRFCVTLLTRQLQAEYLAIVTKILFDNNLNISASDTSECLRPLLPSEMIRHTFFSYQETRPRSH